MADDDVTPTVEDVIAEAAREVLRRRLGGHVGSSWSAMSADVAAAVVATVRAMTVRRQAELIGGQVMGRRRAHDLVTRVVGPWRAEP